MQRSFGYSISLVAVFAALAPFGAVAAEDPASSFPVVVSAAPRLHAVHISGTAPGAHQLQAVLYATFAPDLPIVLLSRRPLTADVDGHFDATLPVAPAFFPGSIITVIVQASAPAAIGRGSVTIPSPHASTQGSLNDHHVP